MKNTKQLKKWLKNNKHQYEIESGYDHERLTEALATKFNLSVGGMIPDDVFDFVQQETS